MDRDSEINPYQPPLTTSSRDLISATSTLRRCVLAVITIMTGAFVIGIVTALRLEPSATVGSQGLPLAFLFTSISCVFGLATAYYACRHIVRRTPLWLGPTAIGVFAIAFIALTRDFRGLFLFLAAIAVANSALGLIVPLVMRPVNANRQRDSVAPLA